MSTRRSEDAPPGRRELLTTGTGLLAGALLLAERAAAAAEVPGVQSPRAVLGTNVVTTPVDPRAVAPGLPKRDYQPVVVPNGAKLPWTIVNGVKVFHLIAEEIEHEFVPRTHLPLLGL